MTKTATTTTTQTVYVRRRLDPVGSGAELATDVDHALRQLVGDLEVVSVALAAITTASFDAGSTPTAGVLVTAVLKAERR